MREPPAKQLIALLDREQFAIRNGQFDVLDAFTNEKLELQTFLATDKAEAADLAAIRAKAARNEALLAAAIRGVKAARERLAALVEVRDGLRVYNATGQIREVKDTKSAMERKA